MSELPGGNAAAPVLAAGGAVGGAGATGGATGGNAAAPVGGAVGGATGGNAAAPVLAVGGAGATGGATGGNAAAPVGGAGASAAPANATKKVKVLGKGGFGLVLKPALPNFYNGEWHEYPDNVTKLFYKKNSMDTIVNLVPHITGIVGPNNSHRINTYKHTYKVRNMPETLRTSELSKMELNNNLFPVRMPDLGKDLTTPNLEQNYREIRKRLLGVILAQTLKLLQQVKHIRDTGYIHGDVRASNIMIRPDTGVMSLIDYDWLLPVDTFIARYPFGFYCHPPETLYLFQEKTKANSKIPVDDRRLIVQSTYQEYVYNYIRQFSLILPRMGYSTEPNSLGKYIVSVKDHNTSKNSMKNLLRSFDSYGLAWSLLMLFAYLYPGCVNSKLTDAIKVDFKGSLGLRLPAGTNVDAATTAILAMTSQVLIPLSDMDISDRLDIDEAVLRTMEIMAAYEAATPPATGGGGSAAATGGGGSAAATGGGGSAAATASNSRRARRFRRATVRRQRKYRR